MKPFVLYDLINNTEQVILRPERIALYNPPVRKKCSRKRVMKRFLRVVKEKLKWAAIMLTQLAISFASGFLFYIAIAEKLREVRGYDAKVGDEDEISGQMNIFDFPEYLPDTGEVNSNG